MGRPRLHDKSTERDLIRAAERLLATEGAEGLSVRRLAQAAGTSARAIYSVFGSMEGLLGALFREAFLALISDLDAQPPTDDPIADLIALGDQGFRVWALKRPALYGLVFGGRPLEPGVPDADADAGVQAFGRLIARVRRCSAAGLFPEGDEPAIAMSFHALCEGMASLELRGRFPVDPVADPADAWRQALAALVNGYRTGPA